MKIPVVLIDMDNEETKTYAKMDGCHFVAQRYPDNPGFHAVILTNGGGILKTDYVVGWRFA